MSDNESDYGSRIVIDTDSHLSSVEGTLTFDPNAHYPVGIVVTYPGVPVTGWAVQEEDGYMRAYLITDSVWVEIQSLSYDPKVDHIATYLRDRRPVMERIIDESE